MRNNPLGYLTTTMVRSYDCPKKYFYEYVEGWRPLRPSANLVFGSIVHESIAEGLSNGHLTKDLFIEKWKKVEELIYSRSDTHQSLEGIGLSLISKLEKTPVYRRAVAVEKAYQVELADGTIFKGKIDIIYNDGRENVVLDWKTSSRSFLDSRPELDDQLTAYSMLAGIPKVAYGVLLKKKEPEINFLFATRDEKDYLDYQVKIMKIVADIEAGFFYRKPSIYCSFCAFTPLCCGQKEKVESNLTKRPVEDRYKEIECEKVYFL